MKNQREIKFRVWLKNRDEMVYKGDGLYIDGFTGDIYIPHFENPNQLDKMDDVILMQFTGLKDKNGKEIYEGDILEDKDWGIGIVGWNNFDAQWVLECQCDYTALHFVIEQGAIILGNTMENPELLK